MNSPAPESPNQSPVENLAAGKTTSEDQAVLDRRAAEALRETEQRFRTVVEGATLGVFIASEMKFEYLNPAALRVFGASAPEELIGQPVLSRVHPAFHGIVRGRANRVEGGHVSRVPLLQEVYVRLDGSPVDVEVTAFATHYQGRQGAVVFVQDITDRLRAERELRQSEDRYRLLVEGSPDMIGIYQANRLIFVNSTGVRLMGASSKAELLGKTGAELIHPDDYAGAQDRIRRRLDGDTTAYPAEVRYVRLDGTVLPAEVSAAPVHFAGQPGVQFIARDISERKRLELQLRQAQKLDGIGQLAGGVAHDFNNILAAVLMQLGMLRLRSKLDAEATQAVVELETAIQRAATLTRQLLMFSRRSVLEVRPLDLNEVVEDLLRMLERLIGEHIKVSFEASVSARPTINADSGMLEQVLMNLVVNSRDAMPNGGRITIRTSVRTLGQEDLEGNADRRCGRFVCLSVSDTGVGMTPETLERAFEPFFTTKEPGKGTGLGLATVHGIVAQHQGWVEVKSEVGHGAEFRVFLPAQAEQTAPEAQDLTQAPIQRGQETILVVEDETNLRGMVSQALRALGYQVYEAENGQRAIEIWEARGTEIDLLLADMVMPEGMTGLELAERLRVERPGLKVIISSGYSPEFFEAGGIPTSGIRYLPKPYQTHTLSKAIRDSLESA